MGRVEAREPLRDVDGKHQRNISGSALPAPRSIPRLHLPPAPAVRGTLAAPEPTKSGPNGDLALPVEAGAEGEDDGFGEAEYAAINSMLDQINSCLDHLEEKNDHLHAHLQELLESNWQTRLEFQQQLGEAPPDASP
ncbi:UPF0184 protein C9orf16-like [Canis lupus familiaris]|uniref:UPF0184 protein C9orf16-like n=1 Tax=Canis lupus familiaris TaxID=9615 RepID=UPI0015F1A484|nr:UPF0184 protein C9orf16-like [Canis lupus familiaris]XP_038416563.1 UPF0184 protein C9orf16-like [Canis lupus familiaris]